MTSPARRLLTSSAVPERAVVVHRSFVQSACIKGEDNDKRPKRQKLEYKESGMQRVQKQSWIILQETKERITRFL